MHIDIHRPQSRLVPDLELAFGSRKGFRQKLADEEGEKSDMYTFRDIEPTSGRLVVFLSGAIEHAVLPSYSDRVAITCWMR